MFNITGKDLAYTLTIAIFLLAIGGSLITQNSLILLIVAFPLVLINRAFLIPLLLIIPTIEGAFATADTPPITETLTIIGLTPVFLYDLLKKNSKTIPVQFTLLYLFFCLFLIIGLIVYKEHPEIWAGSKNLSDIYLKGAKKFLKVIFFLLFLKVLINYGKEYIIRALTLLKDVVPYLIVIIAVYLVFFGKFSAKFGSLDFGDAHHGGFAANVCAFGVYLFIGIFENRRSFLYRVIMVTALAAMLYAVMQIASRNGLLSFGLMCMISTYLVLRNRSSGLKMLMVLAGFFALVVAAYKFQDSPTIQRTIYQTEVKGGGDRLSYWSAGVEAIGYAPFLGFGGDESSSLYAVSKYSPEVEDHVMHNTFLEFAVEYGLIGLSFFLIFVATILSWAYRNFRYALKTNDLILAAPGISYFLSIVAGLFISRIWDSAMWYYMSLVFAVGILWVYPKIQPIARRMVKRSSYEMIS